MYQTPEQLIALNKASVEAAWANEGAAVAVTGAARKFKKAVFLEALFD